MPGDPDALPPNAGSEHVIDLFEVGTIPGGYGWGALLPHAHQNAHLSTTEAVPALRDKALIKGSRSYARRPRK